MTELVFAVTVGAVAAAGLYLATARDAVTVVLGLALLGAAANLFVFGMGRLHDADPPIVPEGLAAPAGSVANPLPQALVLTAIVIGFALACLALALALALHREPVASGTDALDAGEPAPRPDGEPEHPP